MLAKIRNEREYKLVMKTIESLLSKATKAGGFHHLTTEEATMLGDLSKLAETYEDGILQLMPIKPKSLKEAVEFKMAEKKLTQEKLAKKLGIGAPKLSQILTGKRAPDVVFLKAVHKKLNIDAEFLLTHV
ncbi:helix-turn-helix domain-containing protein [Parachryseolinea silvisoli]|uniref:helix-turn-helix domain-containing protein n=1 Tax=Parachryseolinea silvisoli TaxID=2873601 RepID=UPI002265C1D0|nr:helix-turn-helix domain-containing protein [Parachryseolinea silvisoli]MCD9015189.1 helix-turn-helix domain-containing protein [Parachryseolinea silvisoli]